MQTLMFMLAKARQEEILRQARERSIDLGPFQDEEEELLALDHERQFSDEAPARKRELTPVS